MENTQETIAESPILSVSSDHPWLEVDGEVDEDLRFSLDELRFA